MPFVTGLPFGWLHVISHGVESAVAADTSLVPLGTLASIDRGLIALLRLPTLSSAGFKLSTEKDGEPAPLPPPATERVSLLFQLLGEYVRDSIHVASSHQSAIMALLAGGETPTLVRHECLRRTFAAPPLPGSSSALSSRTVLTYALVELSPPRGSPQAQEGKPQEEKQAATNSTKHKHR